MSKIKGLPKPRHMGVDTSFYQGRVDAGLLKSHGVEFLFARVTLGSSLDSEWEHTAESCAIAGLVWRPSPMWMT